MTSPSDATATGGVVLTHDRLENWAGRIFSANGLPIEDAATAAHALVKANLRGVDSHGVARIPMYCRRLRRGLAKACPDIKVERVAPAVAQVDGDDGLGLVVGKRAMAEAVAMARQSGIGLAGVHRSGHYGMAALYILQAIAADCIGLAFTNASPAMPPWGGRNPLLGTNPMAAGVPTAQGPPFVMDMACSIVARGKLKFAAQRGEPIPPGLALDKHGRPTTDGQAAFEGVVLPMGGVKGAALSMLMDVLSGVFTGAAFGGDVRNPFTGLDGPQGTGHCFIAVDAALFMPLETFTDRMQVLAQRVKSQPTAAGVAEILMPGEPEQRNEARRRAEGVPLSADVVAGLHAEGRRVGVPFPTPC
jgi:L-2-hydroxycarboxylate dehydrogenase (NAD+)